MRCEVYYLQRALVHFVEKQMHRMLHGWRHLDEQEDAWIVEERKTRTFSDPPLGSPGFLGEPAPNEMSPSPSCRQLG